MKNVVKATTVGVAVSLVGSALSIWLMGVDFGCLGCFVLAAALFLGGVVTGSWLPQHWRRPLSVVLATAGLWYSPLPFYFCKDWPYPHPFLEALIPPAFVCAFSWCGVMLGIFLTRTRASEIVALNTPGSRPR